MDDRFLNAYFPPEARICGRWLKRFSAFHYLSLKAIDSPFLESGREIKPGDLLAAVAICRRSFSDHGPIRRTFADIWWRRKLIRNHKLFREECDNFSLFLEAHSSGPRFWPVTIGEFKTRDLTGPDILILVVSLMRKARVSEAEAWDMSLGRAEWINAQVAEIEGSERRFLDERELVETSEALDAADQELSEKSDEEILSMFRMAFDEETAQESLRNWKANKKGKEANA